MNHKRYWIRFVSPGSDARPVKVPSPVEWWHSGYTSDDDAVIVALAHVDHDVAEVDVMNRVSNALEPYWPDHHIEFATEVTSEWRPGDRFVPKASSPDGFVMVVL